MKSREKIVWTFRKILDSPDENFISGCKELETMKANSDEVAQLLKEEFKQSTAHNKLHLLNVVNQILFDTMREGKEFVKSFGDNLSDLITETANTVNVVDFLDSAIRILNMWEEKKIFAPKFMEKMRKLLLNKKVIIFENHEPAQPGRSTTSGFQGQSAQATKARISKAQIRDFNLVMDNSYTKEAFDIKQMENNHDKNAPKIDEISKNLDQIQTLLTTLNRRELMTKLNEWKTFLQTMKSEVSDGLIRCSTFCLNLSKVNEDEYINLMAAKQDQ